MDPMLQPLQGLTEGVLHYCPPAVIGQSLDDATRAEGEPSTSVKAPEYASLGCREGLRAAEPEVRRRGSRESMKQYQVYKRKVMARFLSPLKLGSPIEEGTRERLMVSRGPQVLGGGGDRSFGGRE